MLARISNRDDPDQTASSSPIWICAVCLGLFGGHLVFKNLEQLP